MGRVRKDRVMRRRAVSFAALALMLAGSAPARAQPVPPTREELQVTQPRPQTRGSRLTVEGDIERGPCPLADPAYGQVKVTFAAVDFGSQAALPPEALRQTWADYAGREVPIASLCEVRDRAATRLRELGYLAAVQIPPQRIDTGGTVRMDVLIAKLVDIQVRGRPGNSERLIAAHLRRLTERPYFNGREAERSLLLARDLPGYDVRLVLRPAGTAPGEVVGDVVVTRRPVELYATVQNLGAQTSGPLGGFAQLVLNDLIGLGDRTTLSVYNTAQVREQTVAEFTHEFALNANGLRLGGQVVYGRGHPDVAGGNFRTETWIFEGHLRDALVRRQALSLGATLGLEAIDQKVRFGTSPLSQDRLRVAFARLDLDAFDPASLRSRGGFTASEPRWRAAIGVELRQGLGVLGASHDCKPVTKCLFPVVPISNLTADPAGFVTRAEGAFEFRPSPAVTLALTPRVQYSPDALLSYEQFSLGNYTVGRGFDPGIVQGDSGIGSGFEIRAGRLIPRSPDQWRLQPFAFLDTAWVWTNDGGATADPRHVWSAGGGVRARWGDHADFNLTLALPLDRAGTQTHRGDVRALFTVTTRLIPWRGS